MRAPAILLLLLSLGAVASAAPDPEAGFRAAEQQLAHGDLAGAVDAFVAVADGAPGSPQAYDALVEAARGAEKLGQLARAVTLWRRIVAQYPDGRKVAQAEARLAALTAEIGPHGEWIDVAVAHEAMLHIPIGRDLSPVERLDAQLRAHPDYPRAAEARMLVANAWLRAGQIERAEAGYREVAAHATAPLDRWYAQKALADIALARGDLDDAEDAYRALRRGAGPDEETALDEAMRTLDTQRGRARRERVAMLFLLLALAGAIAFARREAGSWPRAARALATPPIEVWYAAPVALLLGLLAWNNDPTIGVAVAWVGAGGLVVAWLSGALLDAARARRGRVSLARASTHAVIAVAAVVSIAYLTLVRTNILDQLLETWRHGHDG